MKPFLKGALAVGIALFAVIQTAAADTYPSKPIRFIVPFPPGGPTDVVARLVGQKLSESLGQSVVIDNRPGAGGIIGTDQGAKAAPDGYTIIAATAQLAVHPSLQPKMPFDVAKDFAPIGQTYDLPMVMVVNLDVPAKTFQDVIKLAKDKPGEFSYTSSSNGSFGHLAIEQLKSVGGFDMVHIPYKGAAPAMTDVLAGQVPFMFSDIITALPHIRDNKVRAIAIGNAKRSELLPELPTVADAGFPGFSVSAWGGIMAPKGTPKEVIDRLSGEIRKIMADPDVRKRMLQLGVEPVASSPEEFAALIRADTERWAKVIKENKIVAE